MANNYKVKIVDLQNKYKFKIFAISSNTVMKNEIDALYQAWPKESGTGTSASLTGTIAAPMNIDLKGNTSQASDPTPSSPVDVNVVTGDNTITIANSDNTESQSYPINLGTMELCKIRTYQDYIYKENDKWYKYGAIGKSTFVGASDVYENWIMRTDVAVTGYKCYRNGNFNVNSLGDLANAYSNYFKYVTSGNFANTFRLNSQTSGYGIQVIISETLASSTNDFKTWLSTHNVNVYYVLSTPTTTEITDATLISQLEALKGAVSYAGQTNISQVNDDEAFIISASALKDLSNL